VKDGKCPKKHLQINQNGDLLYKCPIKLCDEYLTIYDKVCKNGHTGAICYNRVGYNREKCSSPILESGYCTVGHNGIICDYPDCLLYLVNNVCPSLNVFCSHCNLNSTPSISNNKYQTPIYLNHDICVRINAKHCDFCGEPVNERYCSNGHDGTICNLYFSPDKKCNRYKIFDKCPLCDSGSFTKSAIKQNIIY